MKKSVKFVMLMMAVAAVSSCVDLNWDEKKQENANNSFFSKMVGRIDPDHLWNLAKEGSVTVSTASATEIKVYSFNGKSYKLLADKTVDGSEKISFDVFSGINEVLVEDQKTGARKTVALGGNASFSSTRSVFSDNGVVSASYSGKYSEFSYTGVSSDVAGSEFENVEYSVEQFVAPTGTFTINPVWYTSESGSKATLGIYMILTDGGKSEIVYIYQNDKQDEIMQYQTPWDGQWQTYYDAHMPSLANYGGGAVTDCRSKEIVVKVPAEQPFGFVMISGNDQGGVFYSESKYGDAPSTGYAENPGPYIGEDLGHYGHMAIIGDYLAIDDFCELSPHSYTNPEYDHIVFNYSGLEPYKPAGDEPQGEDPQGEDPNITPDVEDGSWIIACEDVFPGTDVNGSCDYDFNDVVFEVSHVAGASNIIVTFLAAGSTLGNSVYFGDENLGEIHAILGHPEKVKDAKNPNAKEAYQMINTNSKGLIANVVTITLPCPENFSMSKDMGGFKIVRDGGVKSVVEAPEKGCVPYMICVPGDWKWCVENQPIFSAYPQFGGWSNNHLTNLDWYENCASESMVFKFPSMSL